MSLTETGGEALRWIRRVAWDLGYYDLFLTTGPEGNGILAHRKGEECRYVLPLALSADWISDSLVSPLRDFARKQDARLSQAVTNLDRDPMPILREANGL